MVLRAPYPVPCLASATFSPTYPETDGRMDAHEPDHALSLTNSLTPSPMLFHTDTYLLTHKLTAHRRMILCLVPPLSCLTVTCVSSLSAASAILCSHPTPRSSDPLLGLKLKGRVFQRPGCAASLSMAKTTINPPPWFPYVSVLVRRQDGTLQRSDHTPLNPRHAGTSPRRPQLYGCPLHLSLKPFRIDNRDPGTWINTLLCTE